MFFVTKLRDLHQFAGMAEPEVQIMPPIVQLAPLRFSDIAPSLVWVDHIEEVPSETESRWDYISLESVRKLPIF